MASRIFWLAIFYRYILKTDRYWLENITDFFFSNSTKIEEIKWKFGICSKQKNYMSAYLKLKTFCLTTCDNNHEVWLYFGEKIQWQSNLSTYSSKIRIWKGTCFESVHVWLERKWFGNLLKISHETIVDWNQP